LVDLLLDQTPNPKRIVVPTTDRTSVSQGTAVAIARRLIAKSCVTGTLKIRVSARKTGTKNAKKRKLE
jgi:hypothetical protein